MLFNVLRVIASVGMVYVHVYTELRHEGSSAIDIISCWTILGILCWANSGEHVFNLSK